MRNEDTLKRMAMSTRGLFADVSVTDESIIWLFRYVTNDWESVCGVCVGKQGNYIPKSPLFGIM